MKFIASFTFFSFFFLRVAFSSNYNGIKSYLILVLLSLLVKMT